MSERMESRMRADEVLRQVEKGEAVPTIAEALKNKDMLPYLIQEIRNMRTERPEDALSFLKGLDAAEEALNVENITWEQMKDVLSSAGVVFGGALGVAILSYVVNGSVEAAVPAAATAVTGTFALSSVGSGIMQVHARRQAQERVRKLRSVIAGTV